MFPGFVPICSRWPPRRGTSSSSPGHRPGCPFCIGFSLNRPNGPTVLFLSRLRRNDSHAAIPCTCLGTSRLQHERARVPSKCGDPRRRTNGWPVGPTMRFLTYVTLGDAQARENCGAFGPKTTRSVDHENGQKRCTSLQPTFTCLY